ncbi:Dicer-like protein 2 [Pleurotus ostreatus]|uniref:Dicer-like protein 2 n=1 Tax=Pleurotus ostreatus TaxID=5322 RepID=A0A8H7DS49_PLEOS|nr:Dicer-like protein 2 [Pleurotus ostreatus]KAF7428704.1 Dicer-like protein 2 [Pleurotus ostreatus]KAJ8696897.1 Dicer-like protein 2 [Pleurotus ostreatus]
MADATLPATVALPSNETRGYQREMLEESFKENIIIALDTGSGKTRIAILRIKAEVERQPVKVCWFLAPTVTLCEQQKTVITQAIPGGVAFISGASNPDDWKGRVLWEGLLSTHKVVVSTPQVLLNALRHGYVSMGKDISLIVFDEAHHAVREEPYNQIMREFY